MFAISRNRASWFLGAFLAFYATCIGLTWTCYMRRKTAAVGVPSLEAQV